MVYLIVDRKNNLGKIGVSSNVRARFYSIQTSNPFPCEIYACMSGGINIERGFKDEFSKYRVNGEWFSLNNDILRKFMFSRVDSNGQLGKKYKSVVPRIGDHVYLCDKLASDFYDTNTNIALGDSIITSIKRGGYVTVATKRNNDVVTLFHDVHISELYFKCRACSSHNMPSIKELESFADGVDGTMDWFISEAIATNKLFSYSDGKIFIDAPTIDNY